MFPESGKIHRGSSDLRRSVAARFDFAAVARGLRPGRLVRALPCTTAGRSWGWWPGGCGARRCRGPAFLAVIMSAMPWAIAADIPRSVSGAPERLDRNLLVADRSLEHLRHDLRHVVAGQVLRAQHRHAVRRPSSPLEQQLGSRPRRCHGSRSVGSARSGSSGETNTPCLIGSTWRSTLSMNDGMRQCAVAHAGARR